MRIPVNIKRLRVQGFNRRRLPLPAAADLRIAQIGSSAWFEGVKAFPRGAWKDIEAFRPRIMAGSASDLQELAHQTQLRSIELWSVDHAVFVLTSCGDPPLTDVARVVLWQSFGVPVYELLIGPRGTLLASECEAQDGWHVEPGAIFSRRNDELVLEAPGRGRVRTGITGHLDLERCACGREGTRLVGIAPLSSATRQLAATA
jgi:hypothetical protein